MRGTDNRLSIASMAKGYNCRHAVTTRSKPLDVTQPGRRVEPVEFVAVASRLWIAAMRWPGGGPL